LTLVSGEQLSTVPDTGVPNGAGAGWGCVTVHVLRHTVAATAAGLGVSELTIAGLLGQRVAGVTARYAHVPDSALAAADKPAEEIGFYANG
jgi:integrase